MKNSDYILYLDMDGVLVDFDGGYRAFAKTIKTAGMEKDEARKTIRKAYADAGAKFWAELGWANGGKELWETAKRLFEHVHILSSTGAKEDPTGRGPIVDAGKREWLKKNMPDMPDSNIIIVHGKHLKKNHASKNGILVDDREDTIKEWNSAGGFGILHDDRYYQETIETLITVAAPMNLEETSTGLPVVRRRFWSGSDIYKRMTPEVKEMIDETVEGFFNSEPMKMVEQGVRPEYYDVCPHCKEEIYEKHEYTDDGGVTWRHSDCGGLIDRPEEPLENFAEWLRPSIEETRAQKREARKKLGISESLPPSGEEKYLKQVDNEMPMSAVNVREKSEKGKSIMDVLPELVKIAKSGDIVEKMADYLISQGWTEEDWIHQSKRYLYRVNTAVINNIGNMLRDNDRGQKRTKGNDSNLGSEFEDALKTRNKHGYP